MRELFDQLRAEAERQILPEPAQLRGRGDRRAARRMATGVLAAVLLVTGGLYAMRPEHRATFEMAESPSSGVWAVASPVSTPTPTMAIGACRDKYPKEIPVTFFTPGGSEICFDPVGAIFFAESVPTPCRPRAVRSDALITDRRGFENVTHEKDPGGPSVIHQVVTRYSADGANQFVSDLRSDIDKCAPYATAEVRLSYSLVTADGGILHLRAKYEAMQKPDTGPAVSTYSVLVRRIGSYVALVYDKGWDGNPSKIEAVNNSFDSLTKAIPTT